MSRFAFLVALCGIASAAARNPDPVRERLVAARAAFDTETEEVHQQVVEWFERREDTARKLGDKKAVDQLKIERAEYEGGYDLPRNAPAAIRTKRDRARKALEAAYAQAIKDYTREKKDAEASEVEQELSGLVAQFNAVELLPLVNLKAHAVAGQWRGDGKAMIGGAEKDRTMAQLQLPYEPGEEYDVEVTCERVSGNDSISIGFVAGGRQARAVLDGWPAQGYVSGLDLIDGKLVPENGTATKAPLLLPDAPSKIRCAVRKGSVEVFVEGKSAFAFKGQFNRLSRTSDYSGQSRKSLFLVIGPYAAYRIDRLVVLPVRGKGTVTK